jgi:hypothetical protein
MQRTVELAALLFSAYPGQLEPALLLGEACPSIRLRAPSFMREGICHT